MDRYKSLIAKAMGRNETDVRNMRPLKKGMTNLSYIFALDSREYILRIPGEGTGRIIDRQREFYVYEVLRDKGISENVVYFSAEDGCKISEYWGDARQCNPADISDVRACMRFLRGFHDKKLSAGYDVDIFERIEFYESLRECRPSRFTDYQSTKEKIFRLEEKIRGLPRGWSLTHMDAVPDNFLFIGDEIRLIDWEYAAMQDPHVDIAMFALHSMYEREQVEELIGCYFAEGCPDAIRVKLYCYIAACGLLCSNWCEYKRMCGAEFGGYSERQYKYAKEYYEIAVSF